MKDILIKWFMRINAFFLRITNGRLGGKLGKQTILLLETIGRKSEQPRAALQVNGQKITVEAHNAEGEEYMRLWKFVTDKHPPYLQYQHMTKRRIPIVVFQPLSS